MKKILSNILILLLLFIPTFVLAEDEEKKEPIKVYEFYSNGCPYCSAAFEYFASLEEEYGYMFDLVKYEVSSDATNSELMDYVINYYGDYDADGVPYIVIGDYTLNGYSETLNSEILNEITKEYEKEERSTKMEDAIEKFGVESEKKKEEQKKQLIIVGITSGVVVIGLVILVIKARKED